MSSSSTDQATAHYSLRLNHSFTVHTAGELLASSKHGSIRLHVRSSAATQLVEAVTEPLSPRAAGVACYLSSSHPPSFEEEGWHVCLTLPRAHGRDMTRSIRKYSVYALALGLDTAPVFLYM